MRRYLFKIDKNIYKANLHCHTTFSDGTLTPLQIKEAYMDKGYSIVAFTDHNKLVNHSSLNDDSFLAINSCEVEVSQEIPKELHDIRGFSVVKVYHLNLYSDDPDITQTPPLMDMDYNDIDAINEYIKNRTEEGFLVCYNHPLWSLQNYEDYSRLEGCFAMEIYNNGCAVIDGHYGYNPHAYDDMLRCQKKIYCVSTDDNHNKSKADDNDDTNNTDDAHKIDDSFGGFVMINSEGLKYNEIINSLKQGDFYSSQGPSIYEISLEDNKLYIKCSDVNFIIVYTDGRKCYRKYGDALNEAEFELEGNEQYIRVMCRDKDFKEANSNAYWL